MGNGRPVVNHGYRTTQKFTSVKAEGRCVTCVWFVLNMKKMSVYSSKQRKKSV